MKLVLCAVARTLNRRVTTATNIVERFGVNVDIVAGNYRAVLAEDSRQAVECLSNDCGSSGDPW